jgi:multidrug efflux system membrane fusion protein
MPDPAPNSPATTPVEPPENHPPPAPREWRKIAGNILSLALVALMVLLVLHVWDIVERHPRTDDAIAMANVVGIAPRVSGQIIQVNVVDNQEVKAGDVLFEIDPADYQLALDNALATQVALERQIEVARSQDENLKYQVKAAEAGVAEGQARKKQAADTLARMKPLLPKGFATADDVDQAETAVKVAEAALATAEQRLNQAKASLSSLATLEAQRAETSAAVDLARLHRSYCKVVAPFPGKVINLNLSAGAFASVGAPVFSLLDLRHWYVIANFREGELRHFSEGSPVDVYLMSAPDRRFAGRVQGIGWAVASKDEIDVSQGTPTVPRELNWVHIAQRFPVRIEIQNPDTGLFRMGASAVAIMR